MCTAIFVAVALVVLVGALTVLRAEAPDPNAEILAMLLDEVLEQYAAEHRRPPDADSAVPGGRSAEPF